MCGGALESGVMYPCSLIGVTRQTRVKARMQQIPSIAHVNQCASAVAMKKDDDTIRGRGRDIGVEVSHGCFVVL